MFQATTWHWWKRRCSRPATECWRAVGQTTDVWTPAGGLLSRITRGGLWSSVLTDSNTTSSESSSTRISASTAVILAIIHRVKWRHRVYGHDTIAVSYGYNTIYCVEVNGEDLSRYSNKTESVSLRKCTCYHWLAKKAYLSAITVANISNSFYLQDGGNNQLA